MSGKKSKHENGQSSITQAFTPVTPTRKTAAVAPSDEVAATSGQSVAPVAAVLTPAASLTPASAQELLTHALEGLSAPSLPGADVVDPAAMEWEEAASVVLDARIQEERVAKEKRDADVAFRAAAEDKRRADASAEKQKLADEAAVVEEARRVRLEKFFADLAVQPEEEVEQEVHVGGKIYSVDEVHITLYYSNFLYLIFRSFFLLFDYMFVFVTFFNSLYIIIC